MGINENDRGLPVGRMDEIPEGLQGGESMSRDLDVLCHCSAPHPSVQACESYSHILSSQTLYLMPV